MTLKYDEGREAVSTTLNLATATLDLVAVDDTYVPDATDSAGDLTGVLDTAASLASPAVDTEGRLSTDPAVFTGLAVGEDTAGFVLRVQGGVLLRFFDRFTGDLVVDVVGDGTNVTINPPTNGWWRS